MPAYFSRFVIWFVCYPVQPIKRVQFEAAEPCRSHAALDSKRRSR